MDSDKKKEIKETNGNASSILNSSKCSNKIVKFLFK